MMELNVIVMTDIDLWNVLVTSVLCPGRVRGEQGTCGMCGRAGQQVKGSTGAGVWGFLFFCDGGAGG